MQCTCTCGVLPICMDCSKLYNNNTVCVSAILTTYGIYGINEQYTGYMFQKYN